MKAINKDSEFYEIINPLLKNKTVQRLREYKQHYETSCYEHCLSASYYSYIICKKLGWDYKSITKAAMLHDLFLYDWRVKQGRKGLHAFTHPKTACENASILFDLTEKEKNIIRSHMWPLTIMHTPKSKEGFLLTFIDKFCAIRESILYYKKIFNYNTTFRYAYLLLGFVILKANKLKYLAVLNLFR